MVISPGESGYRLRRMVICLRQNEGEFPLFARKFPILCISLGCVFLRVPAGNCTPVQRFCRYPDNFASANRDPSPRPSSLEQGRGSLCAQPIIKRSEHCLSSGHADFFVRRSEQKQWESFDRTFSKVRGVKGQSPCRTPQSAELPCASSGHRPR